MDIIISRVIQINYNRKDTIIIIIIAIVIIIEYIVIISYIKNPNINYYPKI